MKKTFSVRLCSRLAMIPLLCFLVLLFCLPPAAMAAGQKRTSAVKKKGWVYSESGERISYHKNYKPVKGLVKIGKYSFFG